MKKYTQPTVEITAFDFEDIICDSAANPTSLNRDNYAANSAAFNSAVSGTDVVVVEW